MLYKKKQIILVSWYQLIYLVPDEINYLDVYKNTEPHKPLPRAIVDFLKEATKSQDSKRALNQV